MRQRVLMRKRRVLNCERLERRDLPAGALGAPVLSLSLATEAASAQDYWHSPVPGLFAQPGVAVPVPSRPTDAPSSEAVGLFFADYTEMGGLFHPTGGPSGD